MPWKAISESAGCKPIKIGEEFKSFYLAKIPADETSWLIAPYIQLTQFATRLRNEQRLRNLLEVNRVRIGLRATDIVPLGGKPQKAYGTYVEGANSSRDFTAQRICEKTKPVCDLNLGSPNRKTDREENVFKFWASQTPQSHHVVEFNHLEKLGVSKKDGETTMDYQLLPAVLLAAEFHQRYISMILKPTHQLNKSDLKSNLQRIYQNIYVERGHVLQPLWQVSQAIIAKAQ